MRKNKVDFTRHQLREIAFQTIFSMLYNEEVTTHVAIDNILDWHASDLADDESVVVPAYVTLVVDGVKARQEELDKHISAHLKGWTVSRIAKTDLVILRLAIFEMVYIEDIPAKVSLNEALELAKEFSDDESRRFINGVLSSVMAELDSNK